jgi:hypothetical protein
VQQVLAVKFVVDEMFVLPLDDDQAKLGVSAVLALGKDSMNGLEKLTADCYSRSCKEQRRSGRT